MDPTNTQAMEGCIRCQLYSGQFDDVEEQLEMYQITIGESAEVSYLLSLLAWYKYKDSSQRIEHLKTSIKIQLDLVNSTPLSMNYFSVVNMDSLLQVVRDFLEHCPTEPKREGEELNSNLRIVKELLSVICKLIPGSNEALFFLAKIMYLSADFVTAQAVLNRCMKLDDAFEKGYILLAQIHLANGLSKLASQALEMGLSSNFEVRNFASWHILKARVLKTDGMLEEALKILLEAVTLPGVKDSFSAKNIPMIKSSDILTSTSESISLFLELADTQGKLKLYHEAAKTIEDAIRLFPGPERDRIMMANADLALERGEIDAAIPILASISNDRP
ncbi:Tetratricopeptide repeat protein 21B, partial [Nowakowskiella sp. JEL0078]